jgi:hypothetical protein
MVDLKTEISCHWGHLFLRKVQDSIFLTIPTAISQVLAKFLVLSPIRARICNKQSTQWILPFSNLAFLRQLFNRWKSYRHDDYIHDYSPQASRDPSKTFVHKFSDLEALLCASISALRIQSKQEDQGNLLSFQNEKQEGPTVDEMYLRSVHDSPFLEYIQNRNLYCQYEYELKRGDVLEIYYSERWRSGQYFIYDGEWLVKPVKILDHYNMVPRQFHAISEFPLDYWYGYESFILHYCAWVPTEPFLTNKAVLEQEIKKVVGDNLIAPLISIIASFAFPWELKIKAKVLQHSKILSGDLARLMAVIHLSYEGRKHELWLDNEVDVLDETQIRDLFLKLFKNQTEFYVRVHDDVGDDRHVIGQLDIRCLRRTISENS